MSELEAVRTDLQRQMDAHVRTLDQLPTAVAIFDGSQNLIFSNAAYQRLWGLDAAFLASRPTDSEVLDRLRAARKLPEQADFRAWKADFLQGYRSVEQQEIWWHLPDRRTLRVVINPNPQGGVTYLFDDVSERFELASQVHSLTRVQSETLDTLKEGVAVFGSDGRLKLHNRAFAEMWNLAPEMTAAQPAYRYAHQGLPSARAAATSRGSTSAARWRALPTCAWASPAASSGATAPRSTAPRSRFPTARRS